MNYEKFGNGMEGVVVTLQPGERIIAEPGALVFMDSGIHFDTKMGDGSDKGVMGAIGSMTKRLLTKEGIFIAHFENRDNKPQRVGLASPFPGNITHVNLGDCGGKVVCQKGAFLTADFQSKLDILLNTKLGFGIFNSEGFVLQEIKGEGVALLATGGGVQRIDLDNETIKVDASCTLAFSDGIDYSIGRAGSIKSMFFGKEGLFMVTLSGTGTVWVQNTPFARFAEMVASHSGMSEE